MGISFALVGVIAGFVGRWWVGRLRRGAVFRPPWFVVGSGVPSFLVGWRVGDGSLPWWWAPVPLVVCWLGVPLIAVDLARRRLPDGITVAAYPVVGIALGIAAVGSGGGGLLLRGLVGGLLFGGVHLLVRWVVPTEMGAGDVKLAGSLGIVLGAVGWAALVLGAVGAAVVTLCVAAIARARVVAHGPGLVIATWLVAAFPGSALWAG